MARNKNSNGFSHNNNKVDRKPMSFTDTVTEDETKSNDSFEEFEEEVVVPAENDETELNSDLDKLINAEKKSKKVLRGFHLEPEISEAIDKLTENSPRGAKTKIVNLALEKLLKENGVL